MVRVSAFVAAPATLLLLGADVVFAHPGHDVKAEYAQRHAALHATPLDKRTLARCSEQLKARGHEAKMMARRETIADDLRKKRNIEKRSYLRARDLETVLNTDHQSNQTGITIDTDPSQLFSSNSSCVLTPEVTEGPYYVTGEFVRQDVTEDGAGVPLTVNIQVIDTNTCEPIPDVLVDFWHCNSTGVYSGIVANGNGDSNDATNVNKTFLRGIQQTDQDGVLTFDSLFPGHYTGRATHVHVLSHLNATVRDNNTITGGTVSHVGQLFFDQSLIELVSAEEPYASNTQELTLNADDSILAEEADTVDPFVEYVLLGDSVADGIFAWISFGIDSSAAYDISAAADYGENGGVQNENSGMGGGPGGSPPGGNGTAPSGMPGATQSGAPTNAVSTTASPTPSTDAAAGNTVTSWASLVGLLVLPFMA